MVKFEYAPGMIEWPVDRPFNQQRGRDRRRRSPYRSRWYWGFRGRRKATRRTSDQSRSHRDQYPARLFAVVVGLFLLSQLDSLLTLIMLDSGRFFEANPVMQMLLDQNPVFFIGVRSILWGSLLIFLVAISGWTVFRRIRVIAVVNGLFVLHAFHTLFSITVLNIY